MEVRFVTAASRGIFFLSRQLLSAGSRNYCGFATKKKPSGAQGIRVAVCHEDFAVLGQFCAKMIPLRLTHKQNASVKL